MCRGFCASARLSVTDALRRLHNQSWLVQHTGCLLGAREHPSSTVLDRGSKARAGATVSSRMAQSRCGSAGELLAWRPINVWDTWASMGVLRGRHTGPVTRECSVQVFMRTLTRFAESTPKRKNAKMPDRFKMRVCVIRELYKTPKLYRLRCRVLHKPVILSLQR